MKIFQWKDLERLLCWEVPHTYFKCKLYLVATRISQHLFIEASVHYTKSCQQICLWRRHTQKCICSQDDRSNDRNARMSLTKRLKRLSEKFAFAFAINNKVFKLAMEMEMKPSEELPANANPSANTKMELDRSSKRAIDGSLNAAGKCWVANARVASRFHTHTHG